MKNLRLTILIIVLSFFFSSAPLTVNAISANTSITSTEKENFKIGEKIASFFKKIKSQVERIFKTEEKQTSLFWIQAIALILAGIAVGIGLIVLALLIAFSGTATANVLSIICLVLGVFLPIVSLYYIFRKLLKKHFEIIEREESQRKINLFAFLLSLAPGLLATLSFLFLFLL
jgi:Flp pilus assembly protein TadB